MAALLYLLGELPILQKPVGDWPQTGGVDVGCKGAAIEIR